MITIELTLADIHALEKLKQGEHLDVTYKGLNARISPSVNGNLEFNDRRYLLAFNIPAECRIKKDSWVFVSYRLYDAEGNACENHGHFNCYRKFVKSYIKAIKSKYPLGYTIKYSVRSQESIKC